MWEPHGPLFLRRLGHLFATFEAWLDMVHVWTDGLEISVLVIPGFGPLAFHLSGSFRCSPSCRLRACFCWDRPAARREPSVDAPNGPRACQETISSAM